MKTLTLSLFLFNLLPLPRLDGAALLDGLFAAWMPEDDVGEAIAMEVAMGDVERGMSVETLGRKRIARKERWVRGLRGVTIGLMATCVVLGTLVGIRDVFG